MLRIRTEIDLLSQAEALELLLGRLPANHSQQEFLQVELHRTASGKRGENRLESRFKEFNLEEEFHVLWDVNLKIGNWPVQMDGLLLTGRCAIIIESKNISGKIHFDEKTGEFYRFDDDNVKTVLEDPRIQLNKHMRFLTQWFRLKKIKLPISGLIVFTAKRCEFISKPPNAPICKSYQMAEYLFKIWRAFPLEAADPKLTKIKKTLQNNQSPFERTPLCRQYHIDPKDVRPGVMCVLCRRPTMKRDKRNWICGQCGHRDPAAHHLAVREYFTLIDTQLTNRTFREFCGLESRAVATRLLTLLHLETEGELKARVYKMKAKK